MAVCSLLAVGSEARCSGTDFHRKDLQAAIESGAFPKWRFAVQIVEAAQEHSFDFEWVCVAARTRQVLTAGQHPGRDQGVAGKSRAAARGRRARAEPDGGRVLPRGGAGKWRACRGDVG